MKINTALIAIVFVVLALGVTAWALSQDIHQAVSNNAVTPDPNDTPPPERAKVAAIIDGLTIKLDTGHIIRYLGVLVPDMRQQVFCFSKEVIAANEAIIGSEVRLEEDPILARASDGAWVRYVYLQQTDQKSSPSPIEGSSQNEVSPSPLPEETIQSPDEPPANNEEENQQPISTPVEPSEPLLPTESPSPQPSPPFDPDKEIFINERMLEGGFAFPLLNEQVRYAERMLAAARYANSTQKGLWGKCEVTQDDNQQWQTQTLADSDCIIKGKHSGNQDGGVYYPPACTAYADKIILPSQGDQWFCAEEAAQQNGFTKSAQCP
ncbi:MAG: hypothetical protein U1C49_00710 [Candidatus Andersenbacteria bacterium]|nr:hypothetical protein [bacterium]MDZ4225347.1 hypothetical protein [Candidatus Andersenbacteria bacterium]